MGQKPINEIFAKFYPFNVQKLYFNIDDAANGERACISFKFNWKMQRARNRDVISRSKKPEKNSVFQDSNIFFS